MTTAVPLPLPAGAVAAWVARGIFVYDELPAVSDVCAPTGYCYCCMVVRGRESRRRERYCCYDVSVSIPSHGISSLFAAIAIAIFIMAAHLVQSCAVLFMTALCSGPLLSQYSAVRGVILSSNQTSGSSNQYVPPNPACRRRGRYQL